MLDLDKIKRAYFIGIGGIMMSAVAKYLLKQQIEVIGSDGVESEITKELVGLGAEIKFKQSKDNILSDFDLVIYSKAIDDNNSELVMARELGLEIHAVHAILGELSRDKFGIAVAGMHGKSTITSMLGLVMEKAKLDPTVFVGTKIKEWQNNFRIGEGKYFLNEACEYKDSFLEYHANIAMVSNIEEEHLDYFKNTKRILQSFNKFAKQIKEDGWLVINSDSKYDIDEYIGKRVSFGIKEWADFTAVNIEYTGKTVFELKCDVKWGEYCGAKFILNIAGEFNVYNALAVIAVAALLNIPLKIVKQILQEFEGIWRRFEFKGERSGIFYYDDYAHHPTEIEATLKAASEKFKNKKLWLIYQPHLYSRTNDFKDEFAKVLGKVDNLILASIYAAREENKWSVSSEDIVELINQNGQRINKAIYLDSFVKIRNYIAKNAKPGEVVMTMGAGDIYTIWD